MRDHGGRNPRTVADHSWATIYTMARILSSEAIHTMARILSSEAIHTCLPAEALIFSSLYSALHS
jgi:hypothetical protein